MAPSFGTSGLRGLVTDLTPELIHNYVQAFLSTLSGCDTLFVGRDLRASSPEIARTVIGAALGAGFDVVDCGALGTPALALASMGASAAAIMVTGSHIPEDRNGLKFYVPSGEITKADEAAIKAAYEAGVVISGAQGSVRQMPEAETAYICRYTEAFGTDALSGLKIGVYRHSSVARDTMEHIFTNLGAEVIALGNSDHFIPVDTEAVGGEMRQKLADWCASQGLDAIASTDGDADRPMLTTSAGDVVPGDVLGVLSARFLGATSVVTPVSSNDMVRRMPEFDQVELTRIGSPFVIAAMEEILATDPTARVVGYEANGGFLLGFDAVIQGAISALLTRDSLLPLIAPLVAARAKGTDLASLMADLPPCYTAADRVQEIDRNKAGVFLKNLIENSDARAAFFAPFGAIKTTDLTDGLRIDFKGGDVIHLRPSGNAPEFRVYAQAGAPDQAIKLVAEAMVHVAQNVM